MPAELQYTWKGTTTFMLKDGFESTLEDVVAPPPEHPDTLQEARRAREQEADHNLHKQDKRWRSMHLRMLAHRQNRSCCRKMRQSTANKVTRCKKQQSKQIVTQQHSKHNCSNCNNKQSNWLLYALQDFFAKTFFRHLRLSKALQQLNFISFAMLDVEKCRKMRSQTKSNFATQGSVRKMPSEITRTNRSKLQQSHDCISATDDTTISVAHQQILDT